MATGAMGVMGSKFGSAAAAYSYLIFVLLYIPCNSGCAPSNSGNASIEGSS